MSMIYLAIAWGAGGLLVLFGYLLAEFVLFSRNDPFTPAPSSRRCTRTRLWSGLNIRRGETASPGPAPPDTRPLV